MKTLLTILITFFLIPLHGQKLIKDISPGSESTSFSFIGSIKKGFVFVAYTDQYGEEPWISDGTTQGTKILKDINPGISGSLGSDFYYLNDSLLYFIGRVNNENFLWRTDGTTEGTFQIFKFNQALPSKYYNEGVFADKYLYFNDPQAHNTLWRTDGSVAGTEKIFVFNDSALNSRISLNYHNGTLYIFAADKAHGTELWTSDGTSSGTKLLKDISPGQRGSIISNRTKMLALKDKIYFAASGSDDEGNELYETDGTENGTVLFMDFDPLKSRSSLPNLVAGNDSFFLFNTQGNFNKTWKSDGTLNNTKVLFNTNDSLNSTYLHNIIPFKNGYMINMWTSQYGSELYTSDINFNNVLLLKDINPELSSSLVTEVFITMGNKGYCVRFNNMLGFDIWATDGTYDSTIVYLELIGNFSLENIIQWDNRIFFSGMIEHTVGMELYELIVNHKTSLNSINKSQANIYPNPLNAGAFLTVSDVESHIAIFNAHGQKVWESETRDGKVQIPEYLSKGIYSISIRTDNNEYHHKIVIE